MDKVNRSKPIEVDRRYSFIIIPELVVTGGLIVSVHDVSVATS
jgi:hypothetical protein